MIDSKAHSLLNASQAALPDESYLFQVQDLDEMRQIIQRLEKLEQMYIHDEQLHTKIDELLRTAKGRDHVLYMKQNAGQEGGGLGAQSDVPEGPNAA